MSNIIKLKDLEEKLDEFILSLPCRVDKPYPSAEISEKNPRLAKLLLDAFADGGQAEFTAIAQYFHHHLTIKEKEVANLELCIALVEMKHLELIGDMIESLGGDPEYKRTNGAYWTGGNVSYGENLCEKLNLDILAEQEAIVGLQALIKVINEEDGKGASQVIKVISRIIEDEVVHLQLFKEAHKKYCRK